MGKMSDERIKLIFDMVNDVGVDITAERLGLKRETVRRHLRRYRMRIGGSKDLFDEKVIRQIRDRFSDKELRAILSTTEFSGEATKIKNHFTGDRVSFGIISDTHLGSVYTNVEELYRAFDVFSDHDVDFIVHSGDVHEGLSNRPGHVYECTHVGYSAQLDLSRAVFSRWQHTPIYMIDGNHDRWYIKSNGALIVKELCDSQDNLEFIGHDEGDIVINGCTFKLWHGEDGGSYAKSYRVQKIVESLSGGQKPNVLICGHSHDAFSLYCRNVHCISSGAIQSQSKWMRGKRISSDTGFWIVDATIENGCISLFTMTFYPLYA